MKNILLLSILFFSGNIYCQTLPIDFENNFTTEDFVDFSGGTANVIANPYIDDTNTSSFVAKIVRDGGEIWAGSKIILNENLDFSILNVISLKVYTTAPVGRTVKFKLEGNGAAERDTKTTVSGEWETLRWDFTGTTSDFNELVFMFDYGNIGNGSAASTFLFDDVSLDFGGYQIDLPVTFENLETNYTLTDFEGGLSMLSIDPTNENNHVAKAIKGAGAGASSGTTIGTPSGFATNIPLTLTDSKMTVRVWSPDANTPIRLKVEDSNDPTHTCETQTYTTKAGAWETLEFNFLNQATGTELLSVGLDNGWTYNMASIFFNFGTEGTTANEKTYYFDDVMFGGIVSSTIDDELSGIEVFPNPSNDLWNIKSSDHEITALQLYDMHGILLRDTKSEVNIQNIDCHELPTGIYFAKLSNDKGAKMIKLIKR